MEENEQLYSRQIAAYGPNSMNKLTKLKIFIYGIRGLGIEIAKNIILAGPQSLTIFDDTRITKEDLGSNFFVDEKDIGLRRDESSLKKLSELNYLVKCDYFKEGEFMDYIKDYDVVIITEIMKLEDLIEIDKICYENKKGFIYSLVFGLTFYCFLDYGKHLINNKNNNITTNYFIKNIIKGKTTTIEIDNEFDNFELNEGQYIILKDIKGIGQLLDGKKRQIKNSWPDKFEIDEDSINYEDYIRGGIVEEFIENEIINYKRFEEMLESPYQCENVYKGNPNNEKYMHLAFISIHEYYRKYKKLPNNDKDDLESIMDITKDIYLKNQDKWCKNLNINEEYLLDIYKYSKCEISPVCGYGGGVVSQEIIKYIGLYRPINQWFRVEFFGILDKTINHSTKLQYSRYHDQLLIFGSMSQKKLENFNIFMVGAGAVGCELLKYFAMMGISTSPNSLITVTDHDKIEKSNLSRQFLFREKDIGKLKSECAINSVKFMNSEINCVAMEEFVDDKTEKIFNKEFYEKQNAVIIAVDNFEARTYISKQCEKYKIPYFNCGTDGPYANVEAFIPDKTLESSYPEKSNKIVPPCTLKMFPFSINHCILWTLDRFEKYFNKNITNAHILNADITKFFNDMSKITDLRIQYYQIKKAYKLLKIAKSKSIDKCIKYSIKKYHRFYIDKINFILKYFPPDKINDDTGLKFWTGNKLLPHPLTFDVNEEMCFEFVKSFSYLLTKCLDIDIKSIDLNEYIKELSKTIKIKPKIFKGIESKAFYEEKINEIKKDIEKYLNEKTDIINFVPIKYEKDTSDINIINFVCYTSNLRARNYNIPNLDKIKIKIIAGKIMPAIITSTSAIAGLLALQLYVLSQNSNCETFRVGVMDLSDNTLALGKPGLLK